MFLVILPLFLVGRVLGVSYKINSLGSWGISTKAFKIWRGGKCSVVVPPTLHVIFILTATPLFLLVAVAIGLEYMLRIAVSRGDCRAVSCCSQSASECKRVKSSSVCCDSYNVESDNYAVDRRRSHFVIVRLEVVQG